MVKLTQFHIPFECLSLNIVGPFRPGSGMRRYILTSICHATGWTDCFPIAILTAKQRAHCLIELFARQGLPREILTDKGRQLTDSALTNVCDYFGINKMLTSPYHPQAKGKLKRSHATLVNILSKLTEQGGDWVDVPRCD